MRMRNAIVFSLSLSAVAALLPLGQLVGGEPGGEGQGCLVPGTPLMSATIPMDGPPVTRCKAATQTKIPTILVNTRRIRLNYGLSDVGPSGVASVELWATRDGRNWQRYSNEPPPKGPLVVHVAEEGRYGFHLVVKSGAGLRSAAPKPGDAPQLWVEVDESAPVVKLRDVRVGRGIDAGTLEIAWAATDENLVSQPITISYAATKDGPWTTIVTGLTNTGVTSTGSYVWRMPKDLPYSFHVRVEATDRAGNIGVATTYEPIKVDLVRPKGTIIGVASGKVAELRTEEIKVLTPVEVNY